MGSLHYINNIIFSRLFSGIFLSRSSGKLLWPVYQSPKMSIILSMEHETFIDLQHSQTTIPALQMASWSGYLLSQVLLHWNMYLTKNNLIRWHLAKQISPPLWLFYHFKFFMMKCCSGNLAKAEQGLAFTAAIWNSSPRWLVPAPSVGFCLSISAICARLCRLWAPVFRQNDWHFLSNNQGMVPRAVSWQWCTLFLTNPGKERQDGEKKTSAHVVQLCLSYVHRKILFWWPCC